MFFRPSVALVAFFAAACAAAWPAPPGASAAAAPAATRIVSLIPSLTEDLFAIGAGAQVVGVSDYTDVPAAATRLPKVASFASLDAERVVGLHPDLVVGIVAQGALVADLRRAGLRVELLRDDSFDDIFADLSRLGALSGHGREAATLATALHARTARLTAAVPPGERPRTFVVLGTAPIFTVGDRSYIARLIELAGGSNAARGARDAYERYSAEALVAAQPDVIVADRSANLPAAIAGPPWNALRAVRARRVYVLDDAGLLERPGPRYNQGLAWLIARLHPHAAR